MPRKIVAKAARETPEMRALRAAVLEELSVPLSATRALSEEEARRQRKRHKRFERDVTRADDRWRRASGEWRATQRAQAGIAASLSDDEARDLLSFVEALDAEQARDEVMAAKLRSLASPIVSVPVPIETAEEVSPTPVKRPSRSTGVESTPPTATTDSRRKRAVKAGVAGYMADWRLWDEP